MNKRTRLVVIVLGVLIVTALIFAATIFIQRVGKKEINLVVVPDDSTTTLNGQPVKPGVLWLEPGTYKVKASRQYFTDAEVTFDTKDFDAKNPVYVLPKPASPEAFDWLRDHPQQQAKRETAADEKIVKNTNDLFAAFPIAKNLPHENLDYKIDTPDGVDGNGKLQLHIHLYAQLNNANQLPRYKAQLKQFQAEALKFLTDNGVDLNKVVITYTPDPNSP